MLPSLTASIFMLFYRIMTSFSLTSTRCLEDTILGAHCFLSLQLGDGQRLALSCSAEFSSLRRSSCSRLSTTIYSIRCWNDRYLALVKPAVVAADLEPR